MRPLPPIVLGTPVETEKTRSGRTLPPVVLGNLKTAPMPGGAPLPANNPYQAAFNLEQRLHLSGVPVPEPPARGMGNLLMTALDVIDRPRSAIVTGIKHAVDADPATGIIEGARRGFTGKDRTFVADFIPEQKTWYGRAGRFAAGFIGDVLLDPTTYTGIGALKSGAKALATTAARKGFKEHVARIAPGKTPEDVLKDLGAVTGKDINVQRIDTAQDFVAVKEAQRKALKEAGIKLLEAIKARRKGQKGVPALAGLAKLIPDKEQRIKIFEDLSKVFDLDYTYAMEGVNLSRETRSQLKGLTSLARITPFEKFNFKNPALREVFTPDTQVLLHNSGVDLEDLWAWTNKKSERDWITTIFPKLNKKDFTMATKLNPYQLEAARVLEETLGTQVSRIDIFKRAAKITPRIGKVTALLKEEGTRLAQYKDVTAAISYTNKLTELVDEAGHVRYLKFMGKPLINVTDNILLPLAKAGEYAYAKSPLVSAITDTIGGLFKPHYIALREKVQNTAQYLQQKKGEELLTQHLHLETAIPHFALRSAMQVFSPEALHSDKVRKSVVYYIERNNDSFATKKWQEIAKGLTKSELKAVIETSKQFEHLMAGLREMDDALGIKYDAIDDYVGHYYTNPPAVIAAAYQLTGKQQAEKALSQFARQAEKRVFSSYAKAIEIGKLTPVDDIVAVTAQRVMQTQRIKLNKELTAALLKEVPDVVRLRDVKKGTPEAIDLARRKALDRYLGKKSDALWQDVNIKPWAHLSVHPEILRQLLRVTDLYVNDDAFNIAVQYHDRLLNMIKTLQTSANPPFLMRNAFGETLLNFMADVSVGSHAKATKLLQDYSTQRIVQVGNTLMRNGKPFAKYGEHNMIEFFDNHPTAPRFVQDTTGDVLRQRLIDAGEKPYNIGGKQRLAYEVMMDFYYEGLGWSGITKGNLILNIEQMIEKELKVQGKEWTALMPWELGGKIGNFTETWTRLAHMIDRMDKGWSSRLAAMDVRKFHVDYRDLTPTERNIFRRVAPYYTYMRKNTPIQLRLLIEKPGWFGAIGRLVNQSHEALGNPETSDRLRRGLAIPLYEDAVGNIRYLNWNLPLTDIGRVQFNLKDFFNENVVSMLSPLLKAPLEIPVNQHLGIGMPIERFEGEPHDLFPGMETRSGIPIPSVLDYALEQLGFVQSVRQLVGETIESGKRRFGVIPERTPEEKLLKPEQLPFMRSLLPMRSPRQATDTRAFQFRDALLARVKAAEARDIPVMTAEEYAALLKEAEDLGPFGQVMQYPSKLKTPYWKPEIRTPGTFGLW